jgi:hypothetical protein
MENPHLVWSTMLRQKWSDIEVKDAFGILDEVRSVKSPAELARMRKAAAVTAEGFWAGVHAIARGKTQRQVEGAVLDACLQAGSDGPSLWPWVRSGPYGMGNTLFEAFADHDNLDRAMQTGEVDSISAVISKCTKAISGEPSLSLAISMKGSARRWIC